MNAQPNTSAPAPTRQPRENRIRRFFRRAKTLVRRLPGLHNLSSLGCLLAFPLLLVVGFVVVRLLGNMSRPHDLQLQPTPIEIEEIRPRGQLYVCSAIVEDFARMERTGYVLGVIPRSHTCVQILRQKISFMIDLDSVGYTTDTLNTLIVKMPPVRFTASTQDAPFMSDDEDFWARELPSTNGLKRRVEQQIRRRYDTEANRTKAERYAEDALRELLWKLGYEVRFTPHLTQKKE